MSDKFKVGDRVRCTIDGDTGFITQKANDGTLWWVSWDRDGEKTCAEDYMEYLGSGGRNPSSTIQEAIDILIAAGYNVTLYR